MARVAIRLFPRDDHKLLTGFGYAVARNKPYAGGFITEHYGNPSRGHATRMQIEINRALYMDERRYERSESCEASAIVTRRIKADMPLE